jgi:RHS repeat-associated protein
MFQIKNHYIHIPTTLFFFFLLLFPMISEAYVSLDRTCAIQGETIRVFWSGFSGNVNVLVYKGDIPAVVASPSGTGAPSSGYWDLNTSLSSWSGWETRTDYSVRIQLRANTNIYETSDNFTVQAQSLPTASLYRPNDQDILNDSTPDLTVQYLSAIISGINFQITNNTGYFRDENFLGGWTYTPAEGLSDGVYFWKARFYYGACFGGWASSRSFTIQTSITAPSNLVALANGQAVNLTWNDNSAGEDGFLIYRSVGSVGNYVNIGSTGPNATSYTDTALSPNNIYYYKVKAHTYNSDSQFSNEYYAYVLGPPSNLTGAWSGISQINLSWSDNSNQETGFKIERKALNFGDWIEIGYKPANQTSYADPSVTSGTEYLYRVRAYHDSTTLTPHYSGYSNEYDVVGVSINPQVSVSPTSGPQGTTFQEPGTGFTPNSSVTLHFIRPGLGETTLVKPTESNGAYTNSWLCDACPVGQYQYWAVDNSTGRSSNTVTFTVTAVIPPPQVSVTPSTGAQGTTFEQPGSGFSSNSPVTLHFIRPDSSEITASEITKDNGSYTHNWKCDACPIGTYQYWTMDNKTGVRSNTATFTVTASNDPILVPLHRAYSPTFHDHFYTANINEIKIDSANYNYEKIEAYIYNKQAPGTVSLNRFYNSSTKKHYYSTNTSVPSGYSQEPSPGYVYPNPVEGAVPLYHLELQSTTDHFYTISDVERVNAVKLFGFRDWGVGAYVVPNATRSPLAGKPVAKSARVDLSSGNFQPFYKHVDLANPPGKGIPFVFARTYNAFNLETGPMGIGWSHSYMITLAEDADSQKPGAYVKWGDGGIDFYGFEANVYKAPIGVYDTLSKSGDTFTLTRKDQTRYTFIKDPQLDLYSYQLKKIEDRFGNPFEINYDNAGNVNTIKDGSDRIYQFLYQNLANNGACENLSYSAAAKCRLKEIVDNQQNTHIRSIQFSYNTDGNMEYSLDAELKKTQHEYYPETHLLKQITLPNGNFWNAVYDEQRRIQQQTIGGQTIAYDLDLIDQTNPALKKTRVSAYASADTSKASPLTTQACSHNGSLLDNCTDQAGNKSSVYGDYFDTVRPNGIKDGEDNIWQFEYNIKGNITKATNPNVAEFTRYFYEPVAGDNSGLYLTKVIDPEGWTTRYEYDPNWNVIRIIDEDPDQSSPPTTYIDRYANGLVKSVKDPRGNLYQFDYDNRGYLRTVTDPNLKQTHYDYDPWGRLTSKSDADNVTVSYIYDRMNRVTEFTNPAGNKFTYIYDDNGNLKESLDPAPLNTKKVFGYNSVSDLVETVELFNAATAANTLLVRKGYDAAGRVTGITNAKQKTWGTVYDPATGLVNEVSTPLGFKTLFPEYYRNGKLKVQTDRTGRNITNIYNYDRLTEQKVVTAEMQAGEQYTFGYKRNGLPATAKSLTKPIVGFEYTNRGQLKSYAYETGKSISYSYDEVGNLKTINYPGNKVVIYDYYPNNLLKTVKDWKSQTTTYDYSDAGRLKKITYPNGTYIDYLYDGAGRLQKVNNRKIADGSIIAGFTVDEFDALDVPKQVTKTGGIEADAGFLNESYGYDDNNRINYAGAATFAHNNLGEVQSRTKDGVTNTFNWDGNDLPGRLISVSIGATSSTFSYDALGNRIAATRDGTTTRYVLDLSGKMANVLVETDDNGNIKSYYVHGLGLISRIQMPDETVSYYHYDRMGNTVALTNSAGTVTDQYSYDTDPFAFNITKSDPAPTPNPFTFVGQFGVMDEGHSLYFMRARYYDADAGRFLSEDPLGFGSGDLSLFGYAGGNPNHYIDPVGLKLKKGATNQKTKDFAEYALEFASAKDTMTGIYGVAKKFGVDVLTNTFADYLIKKGYREEAAAVIAINEMSSIFVSSEDLLKYSQDIDKVKDKVMNRLIQLGQADLATYEPNYRKSECQQAEYEYSQISWWSNPIAKLTRYMYLLANSDDCDL